jgi:hypothetical protein
MGWDGMGWDGMGWDGMGWDGMGWDGMGWDGMGWDRMGRDGKQDYEEGHLPTLPEDHPRMENLKGTQNKARNQGIKEERKEPRKGAGGMGRRKRKWKTGKGKEKGKDEREKEKKKEKTRGRKGERAKGGKQKLETIGNKRIGRKT